MPLTLYIDISTGNLYTGLSGSSITPSAIPFYFPDTLTLNIFLMTPVPGTFLGQSAFQIVPTTGLSLVVEIDGGPNSSSILTNQFVWNTDANNTYFYANLALNTPAIKQAIGSKINFSCYLKIGTTQGGLYTTYVAAPITITAGVQQNSLVVPPGLTPLSAEAAAQEFYPAAGRAGMPLILISPLGKKFIAQAVDNPDGTANVVGWTQLN